MIAICVAKAKLLLVLNTRVKATRNCKRMRKLVKELATLQLGYYNEQIIFIQAVRNSSPDFALRKNYIYNL